MWRPDEVIPEHKGRARVIWGALIFAMFAYMIWQIVTIFVGRANPSTSVTISNDRYEFPFVLVCMWHGEGCAYEDISTCLSSATTFEAKVTYGDQIVYATLSEQFNNCLSFDLTTIDVSDEPEESITTTATMSMGWVETNEGDDLDSYYEQVGVYLGTEGGEESLNEIVMVPYARNPFSTDEYVSLITSLTFGKTVRKFLGGSSTTTFPYLTIATTTFTTEFDGSDLDSTFGVLSLQLTQGRYSLSKIEDNDPLDLGTFLGNLGGFWELLIIVWGLCFIAALGDSTPKLKARNFTKSVAKGKEVVARRLSINSSEAAGSGSAHERPYWGAAYAHPSSSAAPRDASGGSAKASDVPSDGSANASSRRPVALGDPMRADTTRRGSLIDGSNNGARVSGNSHAMLPSYGDHVARKSYS